MIDPPRDYAYSYPQIRNSEIKFKFLGTPKYDDWSEAIDLSSHLLAQWLRRCYTNNFFDLVYDSWNIQFLRLLSHLPESTRERLQLRAERLRRSSAADERIPRVLANDAMTRDAQMEFILIGGLGLRHIPDEIFRTMWIKLRTAIANAWYAYEVRETERPDINLVDRLFEHLCYTYLKREIQQRFRQMSYRPLSEFGQPEEIYNPDVGAAGMVESEED